MEPLVKRKRIVVSLEVKLKAIQRLDAGETIKNVAKSCGVSEVTVGDWKRNRAKIEQWCLNKASTSHRKSMKDAEYEKVNEVLMMWFTQQRAKGVPVSGPILQQKALLISRQFPDMDRFTASAGWLDRWKKRYGVRQLRVCGEKLSADISVIDNFKQNLNQLIKEKGFTPDQIYNCDETGLNYKMLPSKTLASREESSAPGHKRSKERLTVMACANASGKHKIPLMVIGKSAHPRAIKNISHNALPVYYTHQKSAWMDSTLFKTWFYDKFVPAVTRFLRNRKLPIKAVLLVDNAPSHPSEHELRKGDIIVKFLPPNVTSVLQPMDQGVLENIKRNYRRQLLEHLLELTENADLMSCLKKITIRDVIYFLSEAWNSVQESTIKKSWSKILSFDCTSDDSESDNLPLSELLNRDKAINNECEKKLMVLIQQLEGCENVTRENIQEWLMSDDADQEYSVEELIDAQQVVEEEEETECNSLEDLVSHQEGFAALEKALTYVEQQPEATSADLLLLKHWRDVAARKRQTGLKQTKIKDFFK